VIWPLTTEHKNPRKLKRAAGAATEIKDVLGLIIIILFILLGAISVYCIAEGLYTLLH
jgi:hypothetical protein